MTNCTFMHVTSGSVIRSCRDDGPRWSHRGRCVGRWAGEWWSRPGGWGRRCGPGVVDDACVGDQVVVGEAAEAAHLVLAGGGGTGQQRPGDGAHEQPVGEHHDRPGLLRAEPVQEAGGAAEQAGEGLGSGAGVMGSAWSQYARA